MKYITVTDKFGSETYTIKTNEQSNNETKYLGSFLNELDANKTYLKELSKLK